MREYLVTLLLAAALCYVVTPLVRTWALKFGAVAHIRTRDVHTTPTPRWGGLAMWIAMALTFAMVKRTTRGADSTKIRAYREQALLHAGTRQGGHDFVIARPPV